VGGIRDFVFLNQYITPTTASRVKNHLLSSDQIILAYYRFTDKEFGKE
jgi:hypothetical protein